MTKNEYICLLESPLLNAKNGTVERETNKDTSSDRTTLQNESNKESSYSSIIKSYGENFTIHGLSKIFGGVLLERIFWFTIVVASLAFVAYESHGFYMQYKLHDIRTEVRIKPDNNIILPVLTICRSLRIYGKEYNGFANEVRCYKNRSLYTNDNGRQCTHPRHSGIPIEKSAYIQVHPDFPSCASVNLAGGMTTASTSLHDTIRVIWTEVDRSGYNYLYVYVHDQ